MTQYRVINQKVEIGGIVRNIGEVLDESVFAPAPHEDVQRRRTGKEDAPLSEVESLLQTGHVEEVK